MKVMYTTLKEKRAILNSFNDIVEVKDDDNVFSYYLATDNSYKLIGKGFKESGEGYIYNRNYNDYGRTKDGWVDVKDFTANELRDLVRDTISSYSR